MVAVLLCDILLLLQIVDLITSHVPLYLGVSCEALASDVDKLTAYFTVCL